MTTERQLSLLRGPRQRGVVVRLQSSEFQLHCSIRDLLDASLSSGWWYSSVDHGEERPEKAGARLKRKGVKRGLFDIMLFDPNGRVHWLELKIKGGVLSDAQEAFRVELIARAIPHAVAWGYNEAIAALKAWGAIRMVI